MHAPCIPPQSQLCIGAVLAVCVQVFGCRKKMSAIAILDFGGANELFHQMSVLAQQGRLDYQAHASQGPGGDMPPPDLDPMVSWLRTDIYNNILLF